MPLSTVDPAIYPDWAHDHWVWLHTSVDSQANVMTMVNQYLSYNISIGAVDLDSMWSTGVNNFVWDTKKFPDAGALIKQLHSMGIRVICWVTSMINTDSPNYKEGLKNSFYLNNGTTVKWWHGHGSFLDYTYPAALDWWHKQMDQVIDLGLDGWKCDGTDPFVFELFGAHGWGGSISERQYADAYYRDFFYHTRAKNPDALIMSRPVDSYPPIYWDFSPRDVVFSGWVGDQDPTFDGLQDAIRNCFKSAWANYVNFGSDIGGYRSGQNRTRSLFLRWAQFGAFMPLMENGGGGPHFPWQFNPPSETVTIYRNFVNFHYELKPYLLTAGTIAYETGVSAIIPLAEEVIIPYIHSWDYMLWQDILVAPIVEDSLKRTVDFPEGNDWVSWFDSSKVYSGGSSQTFTVPLDQFPVFHRKGSIIPLYINSEDGLHGNSHSLGKITALIHPKQNHKASFPIRRWKKTTVEIAYEWNDQVFQCSATQSDQDIIVLIQGVKSCPLRAVNLLNGEIYSLQKSTLSSGVKGLFCDAKKFQVFIQAGSSQGGVHLGLEGLETF